MSKPPVNPKPCDNRHDMEVVHCTKCGQGRILSTYRMTRIRIMEALIKIGWDCAPRIKCRACACPIEDYWESFNIQKAWSAMPASQVEHNEKYQTLKRKAEARYGKERLAKWFASMYRMGAYN